MIARIRSVARSLPVAVAMALASVTTAAHGGVFFDVLVTSTGPGSQLVIGGYDDVDGTGEVPEGQMRVFQAEVSGAFSGTAAYVTEEPGYPGFQALAQELLDLPGVMTTPGVYTALSPFTPLTFSFLPITIGSDSRNLFFWDGIGAVDFSPVGANVVLSLIKGGTSSWTQSINGGQNGVILGNTIDTTNNSGNIHEHLYAAIAKDGGVPDQGLYLFSLELQMTGYAPSEALYFVYGALDYGNIQYGQNLAQFDAAHALASNWVQDNLVAVPEPSTAALLGLAAVALPLLCRVRSRRTR
jgi:uncharacterized membrane protein YeiH